MVTVSQSTELLSEDSQCPVCHNKLKLVSTNIYRCDRCQQDYQERPHCPVCDKLLQVITGCGSTNYICTQDGLVSSGKVKFYYLAVL